MYTLWIRHGSSVMPIFDELHEVWNFVLDSGNVGKYPVAWKDYCAKDRYNKPKEGMGRHTCSNDITGIHLKTGLNIIIIVKTKRQWYFKF